MRWELNSGLRITNQVYYVPSAKNPFYLAYIYMLSRYYSLRQDFSTKSFHEAGHFCRTGSWKSPWEPTSREEKKRRVSEGTIVVRAYWRLSRMHDQFPVWKYERRTFLLSPASLAFVKYARYVTTRYLCRTMRPFLCDWPTSAYIIARLSTATQTPDIRPLLDSKPRPFNTIFMEESHASPEP